MQGAGCRVQGAGFRVQGSGFQHSYREVSRALSGRRHARVARGRDADQLLLLRGLGFSDFIPEEDRICPDLSDLKSWFYC